jgi:predicted permease
MLTFSRLRSFRRNLLRRRQRDEELDSELRAYLDMLVEEKVRAGMRPEEARRYAQIALGGIEQVKEQVRQARAGAWLDSLLQDLRFGARMLRKNPGFTLIAILTLALGIGANAAIFTLTYAVILKSLPVPNPQQLVRYTFRNGDQDLGLSGPLYDALRKQETTDQDLLAWSSPELAVQENATTENVWGALMSGNGFRVLELQPFLGRTFAEEGDVAGGGPNGYQALLAYSYWKTHFLGQQDALGRTLNVNGKPVTVIGVLPPGFDGLVGGQRADIVLPLTFEEVLHSPQPQRKNPGSFWLTVMGRLKPGRTLADARVNLQATQAGVRKEADPSNRFLGGFFSTFQIGVESGRSGRSYLKILYARPLTVLEALVGLLLLLCCANTALLVLARVSGRLREFAVRSALGAPRRRLFRQILVEIALLSMCGLAGGVALGWVGAKSLVSMLPVFGQPFPIDVVPQAATLAFTAALTILSALAAGIWPAVRSSRTSPLAGIKQDAASVQSKGTGAWIVPAQVAVSVLLLATASLLGGSFLHLLLEDSGFRADGVIIADVNLGAIKPDAVTSTRDAQNLVETLGQVPGVEAAAAMSLPPIHDWWSAGHYFSLGQHGTVHTDMNTWAEFVTPGYFLAIGTPILEGRPFTSADSTGDQVCILSASAARYFFPNESPVGQFVYAGGEDRSADGKTRVDPNDTFRVIGVVADARFRSLREAPPRMLYALARHDELGSEFFILARGSNPGATSAAIRDIAHRVVPAAPSPDVFSFDQLVAMHLSKERMLTALSTCFAGIAVLLTVMGLYGLLARSVLLRTKEIGLRLALGASPRDALRLVLGQGLRLVAIGIVVGLAAALVAVRLLKTLLFGISATNPAVFAGVVVLLFLAALAASCIPAWRAARIDPMTALRYE